jgi:hypothetical protein
MSGHGPDLLLQKKNPPDRSDWTDPADFVFEA